jgi:trigger factor
VAFDGGTAEDFQFLLGEKQMLPEFETATIGLKVGETKEFDLVFPAEYHSKDVAGKTAQFSVTAKKIEWPHMPDVDAAFARALGVADGDVEKLKADIRGNLEREVKFRLIARNKQAALDALALAIALEVPKSLSGDETNRMVEAARADLKQRGVKDAATTPIPAEIFTEQATKRVKLGLIVGELVKQQKLQATPEQIKAHIDELAQSYEKPADVVTWYYSKRERLSEVEAVVIENNVTDYILKTAKVVEKKVDFDDVMAA